MTDQRKCSKCKILKSITEFYKKKDSHEKQCKNCIKEYRKNKITTEISKEPKSCTKCKIIKSADCFHIDRRNILGLYHKCKDCVKEYGRSIYQDKDSKIYKQRRATEERYKDNVKKKHAEGIYQIPDIKKCINCLNIKTKECFSSNLAKKTGLNSYCTKCDTLLRNIRYRKRYLSEPEQKIYRSLRSRIRNAILEHNGYKYLRTQDILGTSIENARQYIESQFDKTMSWENYGKKENDKNKKFWEIDHIIPCYIFFLENVNEQKRCFNYLNLQPLWSKDNRDKSNKFAEEDDILSSLYILFDPSLESFSPK